MGSYTLTWDDTPPSMNTAASGYRSNHFKAARVKKTWEGIFAVMLMAAKVPRNLRYAEVRCTVIVPDRRRRDAGNYRMLIEKCLADAMVKGGWLPDDTPEFFEFGKLEFEHRPKRRGLELRMEAA